MLPEFPNSGGRIAEPSATWEYFPATGQITWGDDSAEIFGHPLSAISNLDEFIGAIAATDRANFRAQLERCLKLERPFGVEFSTEAPPSEWRWLQTLAVPQRKASGEITIRGLTTNVTSAKLSPVAVHEVEEKYNFLTESLPIYLWTGEGTRFEFCNRRLLDFTGLTMEQIQAGASFQLVHPDDRDRLIQGTLRSLQTGEPLTQEYRIRGADGIYHWHLTHSRQFVDVHGRKKWVGIAIDITDRKAAEEELTTANRRLSLALTTAQMGDWEWLVDEGRVHWSDMVSQMHGYQPGEFDGTFESWISTVHPEDRQMVLDAVSRVLNGEQDYETEYRSVRRDGSVYWTLARGVILRHPDGKPHRLLGVCMDITTRKLSEQAIQRSEKLAAVGRLAASISHEINNPLESVTNLLYLMSVHQELPDSLRDYLQTAQNELARVSQIATQTLRFYRQSSSPALTDINALIDSVLLLYQGRLSGANVEVVRQYRLKEPLLCLDGELRQAITNLIGNGLDSMAKSGGKLVIRNRQTTNSEGVSSVRISIADSGSGMTADVRKRLFQPFFTTKSTGTGLGLWITHEIVHKHGGKISVRSKANCGTVFSITLPSRSSSAQEK